MNEDENHELDVKMEEVRAAVQDCFGVTPVSCDGVLMVRLDKYNELARIINKINSKEK